MTLKEYSVLFTDNYPEMQGLWNGAVWGNIPLLEISYLRPENGDHRPPTRLKLLNCPGNLFGIFQVEDKHVRSVHTEFQSDVYKDSCVEFFVQPKNTAGYFNFEFNCGGTLLASYITNPDRTAGYLKEVVPLTADDDRQIRRYHSLPKIVDPEITQELIWFLEFSIPFSVLEKYTGRLENPTGQVWHANVYKCGNETSFPHWGAWSEISNLNFHEPASFGKLIFANS